MFESSNKTVLSAALAFAVLLIPDFHAVRAADNADAEENKALAKARAAGNLAAGRPAKASSEEAGKNNYAGHAVDGDLQTRWCAANSSPNQWWQVDLGQPQNIRSVRIHWEKGDAAYRYRIESSTDGEDWATIVDHSDNDKPQQVITHETMTPATRYLRVTFLGSSTGVWGSFWEFEAYTTFPPPKVTDVLSRQPASLPATKAPEGFTLRMFGAPPEVNYPACLTAAPTGEVFVGVDEQGSLGKEPGGGKVLRCIDTDADGVADQFNVFARMDHPRGLFYDNNTLWVLHPPYLTVYFDDNANGVADRHETLIEGISTDQVRRRGADHTTNGIRMGIDGWLYIAVGDFGFTEAKAADGTVLARRGGGVVRIRPDGSEMEVYAWGLRNIYDVAIDPYLNLFTRDNTNDGGGWDIRLSHIIQNAHYGYPSLYMNFSDEIMPPLAEYGGGSGCGAMYFHDLRWPEPYNNAAYTCDWGRSQVFRHNLSPHGSTFDPHQATFLSIPRPTDIDVDGSGRMYVSSWHNGGFSYSNPNVGFVVQLVPQDFNPEPFPSLTNATNQQLLDYLSAPAAKHRLHAQRELLRRGPASEPINALVELAANNDKPLFARVAAVFTLKQLTGADSHSELLKLSQHPAIREFTLHTLTDRKGQLENLPLQPFLNALEDENPRVQAAAAIAIARLARKEAAPAVLKLTKHLRSPSEIRAAHPHNEPHPERVLPHLAVQTLARLNAVDACLEALGGPYHYGALWALKYMHDQRAVIGLTDRLEKETDTKRKREILTTLIRLYHREAEYEGGWWGTRPDTSGPYYDRQTWAHSDAIAETIRQAMLHADTPTADHIRKQLARHKVEIPGLPTPQSLPPTGDAPQDQVPLELPKTAANQEGLIGNMDAGEVITTASTITGDPDRGKSLFTQQACVACHTYKDNQPLKGPHLADIGQRYSRTELIESILKPNAKIAQGFDTYQFTLKDGSTHTGFVVSESADTVQIRNVSGVATTVNIDDIAKRKKQEQSMMPAGLAANLTPLELADLVAYLESLE